MVYRDLCISVLMACIDLSCACHLKQANTLKAKLLLHHYAGPSGSPWHMHGYLHWMQWQDAWCQSVLEIWPALTWASWYIVPSNDTGLNGMLTVVLGNTLIPSGVLIYVNRAGESSVICWAGARWWWTVPLANWKGTSLWCRFCYSIYPKARFAHSHSQAAWSVHRGLSGTLGLLPWNQM